MIAALVEWLLPDSLWAWLAVAALVALIAGAWLLPTLRLAERIAITAGLLALALIAGLYSTWQGEVEAYASAKAEIQATRAELAVLEKRNAVLEREALQKVRDDAKIDEATTTLKDAIDEAAKHQPPGAVTDPAAVAVGCARLRRSGQTGSPEYRRLCPG
jgi:cell division protein FtsB